jgi:hypothetical protein
VAAAGPSLLQPALPGGQGQPPWTLNLHSGPYLAAALAAAGILLGAAGLSLTLRAMRAGWTIPPGPVLLAGVLTAVALSQLGPFGSSDFLSYAAYGRELVTGHNPYVVTPAELARAGDPVARAALDWAGTPSVYGTLANGVFGLASLIGGASARLTVWLLDLVNATAFIATGLLLDRLARRPPARLRAALLWTCNPLLLQILVAGAHVDALAACFAVAGMAVFSGPRRVSALAAGALLGGGFAVKPTVALVGAGAAAGALVLGRWRGRRPGSRFWAGAAGFGVVAAVDFLLSGHAGISDAVRASRMVSVSSPWRPVRSALSLAMPEPAADDVVRCCAVILMVLLGLAWLRDTPLLRDTRLLRGGFGAVLVWLVTWPYVLPWYDALAWALLPLLAMSDLSALAERVLVVRTAVLGVAYLPARSAGVVIPAGLRWAEPVLRSAVCPVVLAALTVYLAVSLTRRSPAAKANRT